MAATSEDEGMPFAPANSEDEARDEAMPMSFSATNSSIRSPVRSERITPQQLGTPSTRSRLVRNASGQTFCVVPMSRDVRDNNDTIHRNISIPPAVQIILDSPPVQRLVDLKQLGCAYNAYSCATHTRKEHSLGVMELAGQLGTRIKQNQPQLNVSDKDILCLRIAGLCHDLGHGPFSHSFEAFLKAAHKNESDHPEQYEERNEKFKEKYGLDMPPLPEHYEHEKTSLMMVDCALASEGLEIDWDNLDDPLKQIGNGTDRERFGVDLGRERYDPFTSRDWIFIKECIYGGPLDESDAPSAQVDFVGRGEEKEFLFDIVNNRHNGLDVDKIDYYDRDSLAAYGTSQNSGNVFMRSAVVAKGLCPNPDKCFKCKHNFVPGKHLMICYPKKQVKAASDFFAIRMRNHENVYTHKKTKSAELKVVDLLLEADKHYSMLLPTQLGDPFAFRVGKRFDDFAFKQLPISRSWMYPLAFLRMDDSIISIIEYKAIENPLRQHERLRNLIKDKRRHRFYKCVAEVEIGLVGGQQLWAKTEDEIKEELLELNPNARYIGMVLNGDDFIIEKRELHHGRKEHNPVLQMRFIRDKENWADLSNPIAELPTAIAVGPHDLPSTNPQSFIRRTVRCFCRSPQKSELVTHAFESWKSLKFDRIGVPASEGLKTFQVQEDDEEEYYPDSQPITQPEELSIPFSPRKRKDSGDSGSPIQPGAAKKRLKL